MSTLTFTLPCAVCNADLKGLPLGGSCPGCGRPATDTLNFSPVDPDSMTIRTDLPCFGCGYNLRTLGAGALCPECAKPVHRSLRADRLCFADPRWLKRIRLGMTCLTIFSLGFVPFLLPANMALNMPFGPAQVLMGLLTTAWACVGLLGVHFGTTAQHPFRGKIPSVWPAATARFTAYSMFGLFIVWTIREFFSGVQVLPTNGEWIGYYLAAAIPLMFCMYWVSMVWLARRAGRERLRKTGWALVIIAGLGGCCWVSAVVLDQIYDHLLAASYPNLPRAALVPFPRATPAMRMLETTGMVMRGAAIVLALAFLVLGTIGLFLYRSMISRTLESITNPNRDETPNPQ